MLTLSPPQVTGPSQPSPVTAVLTGPTVLGPCDGLFLSALGTRGAGSAQLKFTWMVMAPESAESKLTHVKNLLASHDGPTLELAPGVLPAGHTFVFSVRVTSIWGSRDTATLTVETEQQPSRPSVALHGPAVEYIEASEPLLLEADVSLPSGGCPAAPTAPSGDTEMQWSVVPEIYFHQSMNQVCTLTSPATTAAAHRCCCFPPSSHPNITQMLSPGHPRPGRSCGVHLSLKSVACLHRADRPVCIVSL